MRFRFSFQFISLYVIVSSFQFLGNKLPIQLFLYIFYWGFFGGLLYNLIRVDAIGTQYFANTRLFTQLKNGKSLTFSEILAEM